MKPIRFLLVLLIVTGSVIAGAQPNSGPTLPEYDYVRLRIDLINALFGKIKDGYEKGDKLNDPKTTEKLEKAFDWDKEIKRKRDLLYGSKYEVRDMSKYTGESEQMSLLRGVPVPLEPVQAFNSDPRIYRQYKEKVEEKLNAMKKKTLELAHQTQYREGNEEAVKQKMTNEINSKNPMLAGMGGVEKAGKMSEAERRKAMEQMYTQQTGGVSPDELKKMTKEQRQALIQKMAAGQAQQRDPAGEAFTRELMVNQSYRVRYELMSNAEKQEEYKKFVQRYYAGGGTPPVTQSDTKPVNSVAEEEHRKKIAALNKWLNDFNAKVAADAAIIKKRTDEINKIYGENSNAIAEWGSKTAATLKEVRDSEYGAYKPEMPLVDATMGYMRYDNEKNRVNQAIGIWYKLRVVYAAAIKELDEFIAVYSKRKDLTDEEKLTLGPIQEAGYMLVLDLLSSSGPISSTGADALYHKRCYVQYNCTDPRQKYYEMK